METASNQKQQYVEATQIKWRRSQGCIASFSLFFICLAFTTLDARHSNESPDLQPDVIIRKRHSRLPLNPSITERVEDVPSPFDEDSFNT